MPAVLTHKAIMLLARERLARIRDALKAKREATGGGALQKTDLEFRVEFLARQAWEMMSSNDLVDRGIRFPTGAAFPTPLGNGVSPFPGDARLAVSPFAVMGSMGPDITGFSALFQRGHGWVFDTIHKGNPDGNREPVVSRSIDFVFELWNQITAAAAANPSRASDGDVRNLRAYVLGHLCHIAGDVVSHPYINDLEWHLGNRDRQKLSHAGGEGSIDARVAQRVLLRQSTREGQAWDVWWPTVDEVPQAFFPAYVEAMEAIYKARSSRPRGFGQFEKRFTDLASPSLDADFVKDGYHLYRSGILSMGYGYGYWSWWGFLIPAILPLGAVFGLAAALPHSREFFDTSKRFTDVSERGWYELLGLPLAVGSIIPVFYGIWMATLSTRGVEGLTASGLVFAFLALIAAVFFFATVGVEDLHWAVRWFLILGPMLVPSLVFAAKGTHDFFEDDGKPRGALGFIYGSAFLAMLVFFLLFAIFAMGLGGAFSQLGSQETGNDVNFGFILGTMILFTAGILAVWFILPKVLRDAKIPESADAFPADRRHFVRLFDDSTLFHTAPAGAGAGGAAEPTAAELYFPSGRRALLKLWWDGPGDLYIRSEQDRLLFSFTGTGDPVQVIPSPIVPMTSYEFGEYLHATVAGPGGELEKLMFARAYVEDEGKDYLLPTGATFAEDVEEDAQADGLPVEITGYRKLGKTAETAYTLQHADKAHQSIRFGRRGPVESITPEDENTSGPGTVSTSGLTVTGSNTAFNYFFEPGDRLLVKEQVRVITQVVSDTELRISSTFSPELSGESYQRMGPHDEDRDGYTYVAKTAVGQGEGPENTVMDYAADVAALLCMGMVPTLLPEAGRTVAELSGKFSAVGPAPGAAIDPSLKKVYQVFRNWSLDRRRLNEWRMLVAGGARSEKSSPDQYDAAMPHPPGADWTAGVLEMMAAGEATANAQGWVPTLRQWLSRVATESAVNAAPPRPGAPSTLELSQAMAFLLDLKPPVPLR